MTTTKYFRDCETEISEDIKQLSEQGILNLLGELDHVTLWGDETLEELQQILHCNVENGDIDEILIIIELSGE